MTALTVLRDALFGNPPVPDHKPSREGTLAAFTMMQSQLDAATVGMVAYATAAALPTSPAPAAGTQARVYDDATAANNTVWVYRDGVWSIDVDYIASLALVVQPLVDEAEGYADTAAGAVVGINRINMWPDEHFQLSGGNFNVINNGRNLYNASMRNATWQADVEYDSGVGAWRHPADASLLGFNLDLNHATAKEMKLGVGDVFSMGMLVRGSSAGKGISAAHRFYSGTDGNFVTAQAGNASITTDGDIQVLKLENITWAASSDGFTVYTWASGTLATYDILAVWFVRGPVAGDRPPLRRNTDVLDRIIRNKTSIGNVLAQADAVSVLLTQTTYAAQVVNNAGIGVASGATRDIPFSGWADTYSTPAVANWDAVRLLTLNRSVAATALWSKVKVAVLTHATNAAGAGATVLAVGEAFVDPGSAPLANVLVLLRDPITGAPKRVTQAMMLGDTLVGYYCETASGDPAACSEISGSTSGLTRRQSFYHAAGDPLNGGWTNFSGNPSLGLEMVTLTDAVSVNKYFPKASWIETEAASLREAGELPPRQNRIGGARLSQFRRYMTSTALGTPGRFIFGMVGDSWTASAAYYQTILARLLIARFGDGGIGYCSMGYPSLTAPDWNNSGADARNEYARTFTAGWTSNYRAGSTAPDCSDLRSSVAGSKFTLWNNGGNTNPALSAVKLHFTGTADGMIRWRWNGGAWSANTAVQGGVGIQQTLDLTGFPVGALVAAAANSRVLEIEVVSGSVILCGVDLQSTTNGIVLHKLGSSGGTAQTFMGNDATQWQAGFAALECNGVQLTFATNEQAQGQAPSLFVDYMIALVGRIRAARPICDVVLATPPENVTVIPVLMSAYAGALAAASDRVNAAILDLQPAFGRSTAPAEYGPASAYPLIRADPHPDTVNDRGPIALATEMDLMWRVG